MKPSLNNRLTEYVKISERDEMIAEYVDYLRFYWIYRNKAKTLFSRDNGKSLNISCFRLTRAPSKQFIVDVFYFYQGFDLHIASFTENYVEGNSVMRCDLYGKGLLVLNREDLRWEMELVFKLFAYNTVKISRIDYAVDCQKVNWNKPCLLKAKYTDVRKHKWIPYYVVFGQKEVSPQFIRYYEKIKDLQDNGVEWLYPEYKQYERVMRYELQVNSDWISKEFKEWEITKIKDLANFWRYIPNQKREHNKLLFESEEYKQVKKIILSMRKRGDWHNLVKIANLVQEQLLLSGPIKEEEETRIAREALERKAKKQDERIYGKALKKMRLISVKEDCKTALEALFGEEAKIKK